MNKLAQYEDFFAGLSYVADTTGGMTMQDPRVLDDGFIEVTFIDEDMDIKAYLEFREVGEFNGSKMLEVRVSEQTFFVSAIPYVLFGSLFCAT